MKNLRMSYRQNQFIYECARKNLAKILEGGKDSGTETRKDGRT